MDGKHLRITLRERQALLEQYRKGANENERARLRTHIVLLMANGYSWAVIAGVLFCSTRTIAHRAEEGLRCCLVPLLTE